MLVVGFELSGAGNMEQDVIVQGKVAVMPVLQQVQAQRPTATLMLVAQQRRNREMRCGITHSMNATRASCGR